MKRKRFSEEQIIGILKEAEQAGIIREVCRLHNLTEQTFYRWRNKFGGMEVSDAKKLRELERENGELKRMVAEQALDIRMLKDLNSKKKATGPCLYKRKRADGGGRRHRSAGVRIRWPERRSRDRRAVRAPRNERPARPARARPRESPRGSL